MSNDLKKQAVARAALEYIEYDEVVGVGTDSTVDFLIEYLKPLRNKYQERSRVQLVQKKNLKLMVLEF